MAWDNVNEIFPTGNVILDDTVISVNDLKNSNIPIIQYQSQNFARDMMIEDKTYIWGKDGEFALGFNYDLLNIRPHVTSESPTNVYGMAMIYNFIQNNNLERFLNNLNSFQPQRIGF